MLHLLPGETTTLQRGRHLCWVSKLSCWWEQAACNKEENMFWFQLFLELLIQSVFSVISSLQQYDTTHAAKWSTAIVQLAAHYLLLLFICNFKLLPRRQLSVYPPCQTLLSTCFCKRHWAVVSPHSVIRCEVLSCQGCRGPPWDCSDVGGVQLGQLHLQDTEPCTRPK